MPFNSKGAGGMFKVDLYAGMRRVGDGGWVEPPGGRKAVWRSSQYDFEDAAVFCPIGLSVPRTTGVEVARSLNGIDRHASCTAIGLEGLAE